jgi:ferredoxin
MKVIVDQKKCDTTGICVQECPEVFRFQEGSKKATVIRQVIPPSLQQKCMEVANMCPTNAVIITDQYGQQKRRFIQTV